MTVLLLHLSDGLPERLLPRQHLVSEYAKGEQIALPAEPLGSEKLGRHVCRGPTDDVACRRANVLAMRRTLTDFDGAELGESKIDHLQNLASIRLAREK